MKAGRGNRPPDATIDERVAETMSILSNRPTVQRCQLHTELTKKWRVHWKTVDRIVGRARKELLDRLNRPKEQFRCESLAFYEAKLTDPNASVTEQVRARQRIDELLGLDAPKRAEISGPEGGPIATKEENPLKGLSIERLRQIATGQFHVEENGHAETTANAR